MHRLHSIEPWVVRIVESCLSLENLCLLTFQRLERDLGIPPRNWPTYGNLLCYWTKATSRTSILVRTDEGVENARSVRRLAEHSWSEENLRAVVKTPQKPKSTKVYIPPATDPLVPLPEAPDDEKEKHKAEPQEDEEMQEERSDTTTTCHDSNIV